MTYSGVVYHQPDCVVKEVRGPDEPEQENLHEPCKVHQHPGTRNFCYTSNSTQ